MKPNLFNMPNKMILAQTSGGATSDSFYSGPAPASTLVSVDKTIPTVASTLYTTLTDHGYYNNVSITINMKNAGVAVQKIILFDFWDFDGALHSNGISCAFDEVVDFTAAYSGLEGVVADVKIQAKTAGGEFIDMPGEDTTSYSTYQCYFGEATDKSDLIQFDIAGAAVENLYYCRTYNEMETLDWFQVQGYTKEDGENQDFRVYSLVRKIRIPGSSRTLAYDFFAKAGTKP